MKKEILPAIKMTIVCILFFSGVYAVVVWGIGQAIAPNNGKGEIVNYVNEKGNLEYGYSNIGQSFTQDKYFWSRPSAANYNATASGGSNKGPSNPDYLKAVQQRIDSFAKHNPALEKSQIPAELVTASASGLDPDISPQAAFMQVPRIAKARNILPGKLIALVNEHTEKPLLNLFGPAKVNVLKLNIGLDAIK